MGPFVNRFLICLVALLAGVAVLAGIPGCGTGTGEETQGSGAVRARPPGPPADFPRGDSNRCGRRPPGLFVVSFKAPADERPWVIVFDHEGTPRWWYIPDTRALWAQVLGDGTVSWARSFGDGYGLDPRMAHEVRSLSGELLRLVRTRGLDRRRARVPRAWQRQRPGRHLRPRNRRPAPLRRPEAGGRSSLPKSRKSTRTGRSLWRWNSRGTSPCAETGRWWRNVLSNPRRRLQASADLRPGPHQLDRAARAGEVVISTRHTDAVYGIERSSGEIHWKLGGIETAESLRVVGDPARSCSAASTTRGSPRRQPQHLRQRQGPAAPTAGRLLPPRPRAGQARSIWASSTIREVKTQPLLRLGPGAAGRRLAGQLGRQPAGDRLRPRAGIAFRLHLPASTFRAVPVRPEATSTAGWQQGMAAGCRRRAMSA